MVYTPNTGLITSPFGVLAPLINDGTAQAIIKRALQSELKYSMEFREMAKWPGAMGQSMTIPRERPIEWDEEEHVPGQDPVYKGQRYEEMTARVSQFAVASRVYMLEQAVVVRKNFATRWSGIGLAMAKKLNGARRRMLYSAYEGGHAIANATEGGGSVTLPVSTICGFTHHLDANGKLLPISASNPKRIRIGTGDAAVYANVVSVAAADATVQFGRGVLTLAVATIFTMGDPVVALDASHRVYVNSSVSVDGITTSAWLTFAALRDALVYLEQDSIPRHEDGTYWVHLSPTAKAQLWADPEFQNLIRGGIENPRVALGILGTVNGFTFIDNNLVPRNGNSPSGYQISRPVNFPKARLSKSFFNEVVNKNGHPITYTLITGGGVGMTHYLDPRDVNPENLDGGGPPIGANVIYGMDIQTETASIVLDSNVRFLMATPRDDLRMWVPINGLFLGGFMVNSDYYGGSFSDSIDLETAQNPRFKRGVTVVHYGS